MKKILFVLSVILMLVVAACSTPTADTGNKETQNVNKPANDTPNTPAPQQPETPAQPQTPSQPETPAQPQTPSQPQQPQTPTQPEQPPATEQPPAPESQPENEDSEEETQEETEQGGESEENTEQEEETEQGGESEENTEQEEESEEETPQVPEDKSPFEYVKPACVNLADYTYVGDYIFADTMNFAEWKYSNAETEYRLAFEKVARVRNDNPDTRIYRCNHNDPDTDIPVIKATKYKIYVKTSSVIGVENGHAVFSVWFGNMEESYDATKMKIIKISDNSFSITVNGDYVGNISDYVPF